MSCQRPTIEGQGGYRLPAQLPMRLLGLTIPGNVRRRNFPPPRMAQSWLNGSLITLAPQPRITSDLGKADRALQAAISSMSRCESAADARNPPSAGSEYSNPDRLMPRRVVSLPLSASVIRLSQLHSCGSPCEISPFTSSPFAAPTIEPVCAQDIGPSSNGSCVSGIGLPAWNGHRHGGHQAEVPLPGNYLEPNWPDAWPNVHIAPYLGSEFSFGIARPATVLGPGICLPYLRLSRRPNVRINRISELG
jgi:hypothetical protein